MISASRGSFVMDIGTRALLGFMRPFHVLRIQKEMIRIT
jgi:hypothetical protein